MLVLDYVLLLGLTNTVDIRERHEEREIVPTCVALDPASVYSRIEPTTKPELSTLMMSMLYPITGSRYSKVGVVQLSTNCFFSIPDAVAFIGWK